MSPLANLLLAALGLPVIVGGVALVARTLVYRHAEQYGPAIRAAGRDLPTRAEAAIRQQHTQPARMRGQIPGVVELQLEDDDYEYLIELEVEATPR